MRDELTRLPAKEKSVSDIKINEKMADIVKLVGKRLIHQVSTGTRTRFTVATPKGKPAKVEGFKLDTRMLDKMREAGLLAPHTPASPAVSTERWWAVAEAAGGLIKTWRSALREKEKVRAKAAKAKEKKAETSA